MKRILVTLLVIVMVLSLCACGEGSGSASGLQVGFDRQDISPNGKVWLAGGGDPNRISTGTLDPLTVTCVALKYGDNTFLVYTTDAQNADGSYVEPTKTLISQATGVPESNILVHATHSHSTPGYHISSREGITSALQLYQDGMVKAAENAIADLASATVSTGSTQADGLVFVRHYLLSNGTYAGSNFGDFNSGTIEKHAVDADTTAQIIRFEREEKKDVLMVNLGAHATFNGTTSLTNISADFPCGIRNYLEKSADCQVAYFMSAAGNQAPSTKIGSEDHGYNYYQYGEAVGKLIEAALPSLESVESGEIKLKPDIVTLETNKSEPNRLADAQYVYGIFQTSGSSVARPIARQYGFTSHYEARAVIANAELGDSYDVPIYAMGFGDVSLIFASYEMFSENGRFIRENSPYKTTFVITQSCGHNGYIPSAFGYEINCYEAYSSHMKAGSGEVMAQAFVDLLTEIKGS